MNKRLLIVFSLGFSSGLPLALVSSTLQAWFAYSGQSVTITAFLSLISLPYLYRIVWSPLLDRYALLPIGKRRSWILVMQLCLALGFNLMAWLSPTTNPFWLAFVAVVMATCSATQDSAIDAHRCEYLQTNEQGLGASLATLGYRLALLAAGGLALIIAQYQSFAFAYHIMGSCMLFCVIATWLSPEPSKASINGSPSHDFKLVIEPFRELMLRPGIVPFLLFIFFYKMGEAFTTTTSGIMMPFLIQNIGFSLDTIAYVNKMIGIISIVAGGLVAGFVLIRCSLYKSLFVFGICQAITNCLFIILALIGANLPVFIAAVISDNFSAGMASTALVVVFMRQVDLRFTATQFSMLVAFSSLPRVLSGPLGALFQSWVGWVGLYQIAFILSLGFIPFLMMSRFNISNACR